MATIAHYVLVGDSGVDLRYSHWGAQSLLRDVFWGPDHTIAFIAAQEPTERWRSEVWCEGVVCVDPARRTLIVQSTYGATSVPARRMYLTALAASWTGWTVRWAHRGLFDVLDHLALDPARVRDPVEVDPVEVGWDRADEPDTAGRSAVVSIQDGTGSLRLHLLDARNMLPDLLAVGPDLARTARHPRTELEPAEFPISGLHLDLGDRSAGYWTGDTLDEIPADPTRWPHWPGWELACWYDRYEEHLARTGGVLRLAVPTAAELGATVLDRLTATRHPDPSATATGLEHRLGHGTLVNPYLDSHNPIDPPADVRAAALSRATTAIHDLIAAERTT